MSKLIAFPGTSSEPKQTHAEAIPDGINVMEMNADGVYQQVRMMGYSAAIRQLDNGTYDHDLPAGMHVVAAIWEAERKGYYSPSDERRAIVWLLDVNYLGRYASTTLAAFELFLS